jgi:hypothetical protein
MKLALSSFDAMTVFEKWENYIQSLDKNENGHLVQAYD